MLTTLWPLRRAVHNRQDRLGTTKLVGICLHQRGLQEEQEEGRLLLRKDLFITDKCKDQFYN